MEIPKERWKRWRWKKVFEEIMTEKISDLMETTNPHIYDAQVQEIWKKLYQGTR